MLLRLRPRPPCSAAHLLTQAAGANVRQQTRAARAPVWAPNPVPDRRCSNLGDRSAPELLRAALTPHPRNLGRRITVAPSAAPSGGTVGDCMEGRAVQERSHDGMEGGDLGGDGADVLPQGRDLLAELGDVLGCLHACAMEAGAAGNPGSCHDDSISQE